MADAIEVLQAEADEIRERIQPALDAIRADEEQLARLEGALDMLRGNVAIAAARTTRRRTQRASGAGSRQPSGIDEDAIVTFIGAHQPVSHADIRAHLGLDDSQRQRGNLSTRLSRMVTDGILTRVGESKRTSKYMLAVKGE